MPRIQLRKLFFCSGKWTSASSPLHTNWRALRRTRLRKLFRLLGPMSTSCSTGTATSSTSTSSLATAGLTPPPSGQRRRNRALRSTFHARLRSRTTMRVESRGPPPPPGAFAMLGRERARGSRRKEGLTYKARGFTEKYLIAINNHD
ncbi:hypothetical protein PAHAL_2G035600 [Panicum hallii]|uniref:Uncharacterized protein n=1 Tax=Panicum hallii TaxID=206008 RepID=A0A2S3GVQ0_9POAL|nr:hypothetical protein PAHAL_2G035600 [Panicum hallii]